MKDHEKNQQKKNHTEKNYVDDKDDYVDEEDVNNGNESEERQ